MIIRGEVCLFLLCALLASRNAWSQTGGEVAVIAGATAGAMIVPPVAAQAMTYSVIDVKVETYTESLPLARDPQMTLEQWLKLPFHNLYIKFAPPQPSIWSTARRWTAATSSTSRMSISSR